VEATAAEALPAPNTHGAPRVYHTDPRHDERVRELIAVGMERIDRLSMNAGIGVIDFADATVVVISQKIPHREVFEVQRPNENSIREGGFH
jgi:hypothetical protein